MDVDQKVEQVMNRLPEAKRVVYDAEITALRSQLEKAREALSTLYNFWAAHPDCRHDAPIMRKARAALTDSPAPPKE